MSREIGARVDELEARTAFQEDLIGKLDEALIAQQARIDQLEKALEMLLASLSDGSTGPESVTSDPAADIPPHY
ncbi:MAG: SlyX family protein [Pseudomonadales bacterium]|jgi:SlyX protein|nr:SlyX family protein [Pseudomonadales bacterium]MDP6471489.1 SlyX family protein [Pseudomonadales bacterium]MDP6828659.1 SlyX family protein [Pseudomonadales bacterium]MDP6972377.1 SlyX family protein [Pseudomonadales bacterium]|tara:strand:- start:3703 stop:3924 length:222 start_codon:yes stop_codon:yes gene_type:complete